MLLELYRRLSAWPMGRWIFSRLVCFKAPYFASIRPRFVTLEPGYCEVKMRKRRAVTNHIGTIHAIAMANLCELAAGTLTEVSLPRDLRWIPKEMTIQYQRKAETDVRANCRLEHLPRDGSQKELPVTVTVLDSADQTVVTATIMMWITQKRA